MTSNKIIEKSEVKEYFNGTGLKDGIKFIANLMKLIQLRKILGKDIKIL